MEQIGPRRLITKIRKNFNPPPKEAEKTEEMKTGILHEAIQIRSGERNADYGDAVENFRRITEIANAITGLSLTAIEICKIMMAVKLARERHNPKRDNRVDLCGYTDILDLLEQENNEAP